MANKIKKTTEHNIDNNSSSSDDETGSNLFGYAKKSKLKVNDNLINIRVDTGSSINVIMRRRYVQVNEISA